MSEFIAWVMMIGVLICCVILIFAFFMLWRNRRVHKFRIDMIDAIGEFNFRDIQAKKKCGWRFQEFEKVSYDTMMLKFWKPLKSFYKKNPARAEQ